MKNMINFIVGVGITPEIGQVLPMDRAEEAFRAMWAGDAHGNDCLYSLTNLTSMGSQPTQGE